MVVGFCLGVFAACLDYYLVWFCILFCCGCGFASGGLLGYGVVGVLCWYYRLIVLGICYSVVDVVLFTGLLVCV